MVDPARTTSDLGVGPGRRPAPGTPRWVKLFWIFAAAIVLLLVAMLLTRGPGGHGPERHGQSGGSSMQTVAAIVVSEDQAPTAKEAVQRVDVDRVSRR